MDLQFEDKVALVTGGGGGIGRQICQALASEGARVVVSDIKHEAAADVANEIGGRSIAIDVRDKTNIRQALDDICRDAGHLDILISNVGLTLPDMLVDISDDDIDTTFDVNMRGPLQLVRDAVPRMAANGWGRLIFIGSGSGMKASAGLALYSASKYFLHGLTVAAGLELGPRGITANIVCPSDVYPDGPHPAGSWQNEKLVATSLKKEGVDTFEALKAKRIAKTPARRACRTNDVADIVTFLASPRADFINAQVIGVNGGSLPN